MDYGLGNYSTQLNLDEMREAAQRVAATQQGALPPPDMSVQRGTGAPMQRIARYNREDLADQNAMIGLAGRAGHEESDNALERADMRAQQAEAQRGYNEQARADAAKDHERSEKKRDEADRLLDEYRANLTPPSPTSGERVMQAIGAALAAGSGKGRVVGGLLSGLASSGRQQRWAAEQEGRTQLYQMVTHGIDLDNASEVQRHEVARRMGVADALYWDSAIESVKERGLSKAALTKADAMQLELRQKARALLKNEAITEKNNAATSAKNARDKWFWDRSLPELELMPDSVLGEAGQKIRAQKQKMQNEGEGGALSNEEKRQKIARGPEGNMSADERKMQRLLNGVAPAVQALRDLAASDEAPPHPYTEYAPDVVTPEKTLNQQADVSAVADILLRDESGAAIGKDEQAKKLRGWGITSGDPEVRKRGLRKMLAEYDSRLNSVGASQSGSSQGRAPVPTRDPRVRSGFVTPNAADRNVVPSNNPRVPFELPPSNLSLQDIAAARRRVAAQEEGIPLAWVK